jgi:hypothetical protein
MTETRKSIAYSQLAVIAISFTVGLVVGLFMDSANGEATTSLAPMALIGFSISVLLGGASLVLAIVAISLGRASEAALVKRGDESVRLQTELYSRTSDALQKIASSTDVTEKRIEDMISGRVTDISQDLAKALPSSRKSLQSLESSIKKSILRSIHSEETSDTREHDRRKAMEQEKQYQDAHQRAVIAFANKEGVTVCKLEHGGLDDEGEDLFDAIYSYRDERIAVSTFRTNTRSGPMRNFLLKALAEMKSGLVNRFVLVLFSDGEAEEIPTELKGAIDLFPADMVEDVNICVTSYSEVENTINGIELPN